MASVLLHDLLDMRLKQFGATEIFDFATTNRAVFKTGWFPIPITLVLVWGNCQNALSRPFFFTQY